MDTGSRERRRSMQALRRLQKASLGCLLPASCLVACDPGASKDSRPGTDRHSKSLPCGNSAAALPGGVAGVMEDDAFVAYEPAQEVTLQYGSQAGMGLPVVLRLGDLDLARIDQVDVALVVEEHGLGWFSEQELELQCEGGVSYLSAMVMLDVLEHPTVASAAQLDGREALVEFQVFSDDGLLVEGSSTVILQL